MFIHKVCRALDEAKIPYAIVGGFAVAFHGPIRGTIDVDFVINWSQKNLQLTEEALKKIGLVSLLPINAESIFLFRDEYIKNRHLIAWNFYNPRNPSEQVDLVITYDLKNHATKLFKTGLGTIKVLSRKDLIEMKKKSGRPQDLEDVKALEKYEEK